MTPEEAVVVRQLLDLVVERVHGPGVDAIVRRAEDALAVHGDASAMASAGPLAVTLRLIAAHGCSKSTGPDRCPDSPGLSRVSFTGTAYEWCDECRAYDALTRAGVELPCSAPLDVDEYGHPHQRCALSEGHDHLHNAAPAVRGGLLLGGGFRG